MPIDPNIPLSVQTSQFGTIASQAVQQRRLNQRQEAADERANALLQLKQDEITRLADVEQDKTDRRNFASFFQRIDKSNVLGSIDQEIQNTESGSTERENLVEFKQRYTQNPNAALRAGQQVMDLAIQDKLIAAPSIGKRVNVQIPGQPGIIPAIESPQGFLLDPTTGKRMPTAIKARKGPLVSIGGENALTKAIGKKAGEQIVANKDLAVKASDSIRNANEAIKLLDEGVVTGFGANFIVNAGRVAKRLGFDVGTDIENTQAFAANQGKAVLDILGSGALGAGTGISDNDRLFAKQIAAGDITLDEKSIRRIIALNAKVSSNVINRHNKEFSAIADKSPIDLRVELPEFKDTSIAAPKTQEDFDNLPSGTEYISPSDGQRYRKP